MKILDSAFGHHPRRRIAATMIAAALGLGTAFAAAAAPDHPAPMHHGRGDGMFRNIAKLHTQLKLNATQEALWQKAEAQMKQNAETARARHQDLRSSMQTALNQPNADLRALSSQMDKARDEDIAAHRALREQWLALYDSLDAGQKEQVRSFLRERMQRAEQFREHMRQQRHSNRDTQSK